MKIAHLILAHSAPQQLERLVKRLTYAEDAIYIHLDKKTPIGPFEYLSNYKNVVFITNRVKVYWGTFTIVQATLNGFSEILSSGGDYDYVNLLSGQDYPLTSAKNIHRYLNQHRGTIFMNYLLFEPDWAEALSRIQFYHFDNFRIPGHYLLQRVANNWLPKRKLPDRLVAAGKSQWFTIPIECIDYIMNYWENNPKLRQFIKFTWAPDEFIFQTILYNSPYRAQMVNDNLRYIDWSTGGVSPKTLTINDGESLLHSGKLFARKFDMNKDPAVLDFIDEYCKK